MASAHARPFGHINVRAVALWQRRLRRALARLRRLLGKAAWRSVLFRSAMGLLGACVTAVVVYAVGMNALLSSGIAMKIANRIHPSVLTMTWSSAYTDGFARFHFRNLVLRGNHQSVQWRLTVDQARVTVEPSELFGKRVHLHDVWARGVTMRLRSKLDPADATPDYVAQLPPIVGFSDPPLKPAIKTPPPTDANYNLVILEMNDIVAEDVREVWVNSVRVTDEGGWAEGDFYFKPLRDVRVSAHVRTSSGSVAMGKKLVVTRAEGSLGVRIADLDPRQHDAATHFSGEGHATARMDDVSFFDAFVARYGIALRDGSGPLEVAAQIDHGVIQPGSRLEVRSEPWHAQASRHAFTGRTDAHASVLAHGIRIATESMGVDLRHDDVSVAHASAVSVEIDFKNRDLAQSFHEWSLGADVPSVESDLRSLDSYLEKPVFSAGSAHASVHANIDARKLSGWAKLDATKVSLHVGEATVLGEANAQATLRSFDLDSDVGAITGAHVNIHDVAVGKERGWWANVVATPFTLGRSGELPTSTSFVTAKVRDGQTPLAILGTSGIVRMVMGRQGLTIGMHAHTMGSNFALHDLRVIGDSVDIRGDYASLGPNGRFLVSLPVLNVGVDIEHGVVSTQLFAGKNYLH